jgi:hypothetical protein
MSPNYTCSVQQVYLLAGLHLLLHEQDLEFVLPLAGVWRSEEYLSLPSWAPDKSEPQGNLFLAMARDSTGNLEYRASADVRSNTRSFAQGRPPATLVFSVIYVDEVVTYGPVFDFKNIDSEDHGLEQNLWEQTSRKFASGNLARDLYRDG